MISFEIIFRYFIKANCKTVPSQLFRVGSHYEFNGTPKTVIRVKNFIRVKLLSFFKRKVSQFFVKVSEYREIE